MDDTGATSSSGQLPGGSLFETRPVRLPAASWGLLEDAVALLGESAPWLAGELLDALVRRVGTMVQVAEGGVAIVVPQFTLAIPTLADRGAPDDVKRRVRVREDALEGECVPV